MAVLKLPVTLFVLTVVAGGMLARAQIVQHVVSGDGASDTSTDIVRPSSSDRIFRVGDSLLFRYFSPQEMIVELASVEEYYSCDLTNPIKMYTDLENQVPLQEEGIRYFASASYEKCKNGLKLPVHVRPRDVAAYGPSPSSATQLNRLLAITFIGIFVYGVYSI